MSQGDSGRLPERRRHRKKEEEPQVDPQRAAGLNDYAMAITLLDGQSDAGELAGSILRNDVLAVDAVAGIIMAVRDVLRLRGWVDPAPVVVDRPGTLQSWSPRLQDEPPRLRLVLDLETIDVTQVAALWVAQQQRLRVTVRLISHQLALGEAPAAQDLEALMADHDGGAHEAVPDWACPSCILRASVERLAEEESRQAHWAPGEGPAADQPDPPIAPPGDPEGQQPDPT